MTLSLRGRLVVTLPTVVALSPSEGLRMALRAALGHPVALLLLVASIGLGISVVVVPELRPWATRAGWLVALGVAAYVAAVLVAHRIRPEARPPQLRRIRQLIVQRLDERRRVEQGRPPSELTDVLAEAISYLDDQLSPALLDLQRLHERTQRSLRLWEQGKLPDPDAAVLERMRSQHKRQQAAIEQCVREAANAAATLVVILDAGDNTKVALRARAWADDLLSLHDAVEEVLRGDEQPDTPSSAPQPLTIEATAPQQQAEEELSIHALEEALRRLNKLAALANCELVTLLPRTLAAQGTAKKDGLDGQVTPLHQAQLLREVITTAIERLNPPDDTIGGDASRALQYRILHEEYVMGLSNKQIVARHPIGETTLYRHRREAVEVLAQELATRERLLRKNGGRDAITTATLIDYLG